MFPVLARHIRVFAVGVVSLGFALSGCAGSTPTAPPPAATPGGSGVAGIATPTTGRGPIVLAGRVMERCALGTVPALCGTLRVPEDHRNPGGRRVEIRVALLPATGAIVEPDPVVFLTGGPGGAATEEYGWAAAVFAELNTTRDFILVDQRGTGGSNRLVIPDPPDTSGLAPTAADAKVRTWLERVLAELGADPRFYTTAEAMDDIDDVRAALGYDRVNLLGGSYGATAAQYYLRQHEAHVRSAVFDGGTLVDVPIFERVAASSQHALDIAFERCAADGECDAAYPELPAEFAAVLARLAARPVTTSVDHPWTGDPLVIDRLTFAGAVHNALMRDESIARLPSLIHAAYVGDFDSLGRAIAEAMGPQSSYTGQLVMSTVIRCSEAWARYDPAATERAGRGSYLVDLQVAGARAQAGICRYAPKGIVPANDAEPVRSMVPTLLILGEADPQNPLPNVADAPRELPNSRTVVVPAQGHTVAGRGCMPRIVTAFIEAGTVDALDVSCAATGVEMPPFVISR